MRGIKNLAQLLLRNKTDKRDVIVDVKLARQRLQFVKQRAFAGDSEIGLRIVLQENRKRTERDRQTFLFNQTACLHELPLPVLREAAFAKRKFLKRYARALDVDFFFVAAKIDNCAAQRFRPDENALDRVEHLLGRGSIGRLVHVHQHVRAVK